MIAEEKIDHLEKLYFNQAHEQIQKYYATLGSDFSGNTPKSNELVGLLTFPNSGTSWFLRFSSNVTGIHSHTVYDGEAERENGIKNRDVFMLRGNRLSSERPPNPDEPALVKSHVSLYDGYSTLDVDYNNFDSLIDEWMNHLPMNANRFIRLVRNPFDNLRARYHLYLNSYVDSSGKSKQSFRDWFKVDMRRYLIWHTCCNRLAKKSPLITINYADLLENTHFEFTRALQFAGFAVEPKQVERVYEKLPPKYKEVNQVPVHLKYYDEDDISWVADELQSWMSMSII